MPKKAYRSEDITARPREADILVSQRISVAETVKVARKRYSTGVIDTLLDILILKGGAGAV